MRTLAFAFVAVVSWAALADDKKAPAKPTGTWSREEDGIEIRISFPKDEVKFTVKAGENSMTVTCKCEMDQDGVLKAAVKDVSVKGDFPVAPMKGQEMTFKFAIDGKKAKLSDFTSKELSQGKGVLEGDYETKAD